MMDQTAHPVGQASGSLSLSPSARESAQAPARVSAQPRALLRIEALSIALPPGAERAYALQDLSLTIKRGEVACLVGESGSGKSMTASALLGLLPDRVTASGHVMWEGDVDLLSLPPSEMRRWRGARIGMIFQEPMTALNPLRTIGDQIAEMFVVHTRLRGRAIRERVLALLEDVRLPSPVEIYRRYPHQLSGGQRQRAMIAMALALEPSLLIADEPTTALDVTTQAQILDLIRDLQQRKGTAVLFITHDFGVVADIADQVSVLHHGRVVESGSTAQVLNRPREPYTQLLLSAIPRLGSSGELSAPLTSDASAAAAALKAATPALLTIKDAQKRYTARTWWGGARDTRSALEQVSMKVLKGRTLGIVGESGSGKTTLARAVMRLIDLDGGEITLAAPNDASSELRYTQQVQMVFQDPFASLNPRRRVGDIVTQGPVAHGVPQAEANERARLLFERMGLGADALHRHPHAFSGGQRQRIALARALAVQPSLLVADEPVSALDVRIQAQILALLEQFKKERGLTMIFITHDLRIAARMCDDIVVMHQGKVVEDGPVAEVFHTPQHPYTRALLAAVPGRRH